MELLGGKMDCPHLGSGDFSSLAEKFSSDNYDSIFHVECCVCDRNNQQLWLCLQSDCLKVFCSETTPSHVLAHFKRDRSHCLFMNLTNFRIWCEQCGTEILVRSTDDNKTKGLIGLQNLGNTCYMNAALQSLSHTPPLVQYFLGLSPLSTPRARLSMAFHRLISEIYQDGSASPHRILHSIRHTHPMYRGFQQHDSQEFLRCLLDQLHEEMKVPCLEPPRHEPYSFDIEELSDFENASSEAEDYETCDSGVSEQSSNSDETSSKMSLSRSSSPIGLDKFADIFHLDKKWKSQSHHSNSTPSRARKQMLYRSIVSDVFNGNLLSSVQCLTCNRVSSRIETFQDLSLPIPNRDTIYILHQNSGVTSLIQPVKLSNLYSSDQDSGIHIEPNETDTINLMEAGDAKITIPHDFEDTLIAENCGGLMNTNSSSMEELYKKNRDYLKGWLSWLWDCVCYWFWGPQISLHDCLSAFFSADELKGDNMYSCDKCQKLRNGVKYSRLLSCPEVLCVHLKRFRHEPSSPSKISSHVSYPLEGLDLAPYIAPDCRSGVTKYDLISVICHHGHSGSSGHYTCLAKSQATEEWHEFDDLSVTAVSEQTVASARAYILFYRKDCTKIDRIRKRTAVLEEASTSERERYYISKEWLVKFNSFAEPGLVDNRLLVCQHGLLYPGMDAVVVSGTVWKYLISRFGGGPECPADRLGPCDVCSEMAAGESDGRTSLQETHRLPQSHGGSQEMHHKSTNWLNNCENYIKPDSPQMCSAEISPAISEKPS